jgi:hypothetical protein
MSGGGGKSTQTVQNYSPEEVARRTQLQDTAQRLYMQQTAGGTPAYPGSAPITPSSYTLAAENYLQALVPGQVQNVGDIQRATSFGLTDVLSPQSNPYYQAHQQALINPIMEQYFDPGGVYGQIRQGAQEAGQVGSSRQGVAEGIAAGRYGRALGEALGRMGSEAYSHGLESFNRTLAFAPQALQAGTVPAQTLSAIGASEEGRAADQAAYQEAQRLWELNAPWHQLQNYANIIYGGGSSGGTSTSTGPKMSGAQRLAGALGAGLGTYGMVSSLPASAGLSAFAGPLGLAMGALSLFK